MHSGKNPRRFDVVVIGGGITGLSTALHLQRRRISRIALSSSKSPDAATRMAAGLATSSFLDNFTRFSHAFGPEAARTSWQFANDAFAASLCFLKSVPLAPSVAFGRHLRLIVAADEWNESKAAVEELLAFGHQARLETREAWAAAGGAVLGERVLGVQVDDYEAAGHGDPHAFALAPGAWTAAMEAELTAPRLPKVARIETERDGVRLHHEDGSESHAEIVVAATHLATGDLIPELAEMLVPYADQWSRFAISRFPGDQDLIGSVFSAAHGHEWGGFTRPGEVVVGGARYLRKWAGIEAKTATLEGKVTARLAAIASGLFPGAGTPKLIEEEAFRECRPCDELPIVGPMFGEGRILIATGFLGTGLTLGYFAGECLAELIATGQAPRLPRIFWPERLRSLER